jgi:hypothetical protein
MHPKNEHESPESENEQRESVHDRNAPDDPTTPNASEKLAACVDLVVTLKAPKASPTNSTLEGETMLEAFFHKQKRWLEARVAGSTHMHPIFLVSNSIGIAKQDDKNISFCGGQR